MSNCWISSNLNNLFLNRFRISPKAFFQVNTKAAEVLYSLVVDLTRECQEEINKEANEKGTKRAVTVLDVCCGTGTIGLAVAKHVQNIQRVVGVEICVEAVEDAKKNAEMNS